MTIDPKDSTNPLDPQNEVTEPAQPIEVNAAEALPQEGGIARAEALFVPGSGASTHPTG